MVSALQRMGSIRDIEQEAEKCMQVILIKSIQRSEDKKNVCFFFFLTRNFGFLVLDNLQEQNLKINTYMYIVHCTVDIYVFKF